MPAPGCPATITATGFCCGSTFIVKQGKNYKAYRLSEWMPRSKDFNESEHISLDDALKQFPKWSEAWKNSNNENYKGKYKYLYMGFGNGLSVDNSIYDEFKTHLDEKVEEYDSMHGGESAVNISTEHSGIEETQGH